MRSYITLYRAPFEHPNERNAMKNLLNTIYSIAILTLVLAADRPILRADRNQAEASPVQVTSPKSRPLPYRGTVGTVDTKKRTFTLINKTTWKHPRACGWRKLPLNEQDVISTTHTSIYCQCRIEVALTLVTLRHIIHRIFAFAFDRFVRL